MGVDQSQSLGQYVCKLSIESCPRVVATWRSAAQTPSPRPPSCFDDVAAMLKTTPPKVINPIHQNKKPVKKDASKATSK